MAKKRKQDSHNISERPGEEVSRPGRVFAKDKINARPDAFVTGHDEEIGRSSFANLPPHAIVQEFPRSRQLHGGFMDDTIDDVDAIDDLAEGQRLRKMSVQK